MYTLHAWGCKLKPAKDTEKRASKLGGKQRDHDNLEARWKKCIRRLNGPERSLKWPKIDHWIYLNNRKMSKGKFLLEWILKGMGGETSADCSLHLLTFLVYANISRQTFLKTEAGVILFKPMSDGVTVYCKLFHFRVKAKLRICSSIIFFTLSFTPLPKIPFVQPSKPHALAVLFLFYLWFEMLFFHLFISFNFSVSAISVRLFFFFFLAILSKIILPLPPTQILTFLNLNFVLSTYQ